MAPCTVTLRLFDRTLLVTTICQRPTSLDFSRTREIFSSDVLQSLSQALLSPCVSEALVPFGTHQAVAMEDVVVIAALGIFPDRLLKYMY